MHGRICLKKLTLKFPSARFFAVHFVAKWYIVQQKCLKGQIGNGGTTFSPVMTPSPCNDYSCYGALEIVGTITITIITPTLRAKMHSVADRWTNRDNRVMTVWSAWHKPVVVRDKSHKDVFLPIILRSSRLKTYNHCNDSNNSHLISF